MPWKVSILCVVCAFPSQFVIRILRSNRSSRTIQRFSTNKWWNYDQIHNGFVTSKHSLITWTLLCMYTRIELRRKLYTIWLIERVSRACFCCSIVRRMECKMKWNKTIFSGWFGVVNGNFSHLCHIEHNDCEWIDSTQFDKSLSNRSPRNSRESTLLMYRNGRGRCLVCGLSILVIIPARVRNHRHVYYQILDHNSRPAECHNND